MDGLGLGGFDSAAGSLARAALASRPAREVPGDATFRDWLGVVGGASKDPETARRAAEQFVAQALVRPVLAQMRSTSMAAAPFAPGPYEKQFGPMVDNVVAENIVKSKQFGIVDAVARAMTRDKASAIGGIHG